MCFGHHRTWHDIMCSSYIFRADGQKESCMSSDKTVIVIGGGLGGVSAAISLAQKGFNVRLFEKNGHLGGKLNRLEKDGFTFDLGPSILTMPQIFEKLFRDGGRDMADYVKIQRLDLEWRSFFPDGSVIDLYGDLDRMAQANPQIDPKHMEEYRAFLDYARNLYDATDKGYFEMGLENTPEVLPAYDQLLGEKDYADKKREKFEPACSGLVLHLGVDRLYPQLAHHNFFFSSNPRGHFNKVFHSHELPDDPILYVVNSSKTDPGQALPGHENIKILPHIPYIQDKDFSREEYMQLRERVLIKMENMGITDLRKHIVTEDMWIPADIKHMYKSDRGAIYGTLSDKKKNKGFKNPKKSALFDNLYFVGGTVNPGGGMPMVTLSGQKTAELIAEGR